MIFSVEPIDEELRICKQRGVSVECKYMEMAGIVINNNFWWNRKPCCQDGVGGIGGLMLGHERESQADGVLTKHCQHTSSKGGVASIEFLATFMGLPTFSWGLQQKEKKKGGLMGWKMEVSLKFK